MPKKKLLTAIGASLIALGSSLNVDYDDCYWNEMTIRAENNGWYVTAHLDDQCNYHQIECARVQIDSTDNKVVCETSCVTCQDSRGDKIYWKGINDWTKIQFVAPDDDSDYNGGDLRRLV